MFKTVAYALQALSEESYAQIILRLKRYFQEGKGSLKFKTDTELPGPVYYPLEEYFSEAGISLKINRQAFDNFENFRIPNDDHIRPHWHFQFFRQLGPRERAGALNKLVQLNLNGEVRWFTEIEGTTHFDTKVQLSDIILFREEKQGPGDTLMFTRDGFLYKGRVSVQNGYGTPRTICTQDGHPYCGTVLQDLAYQHEMSNYNSHSDEPDLSELNKSFEAWMSECHPHADYSSWTDTQELSVVTIEVAYRLDQYVSELISLLPIINLQKRIRRARPTQDKQVYAGSLKEFLMRYAKHRVTWEAKTSWEIREEDMPDQNWLTDSIANVNSAKPSMRSVKNSKAWYNGKTVTRSAKVRINEKNKRYHRFLSLESYHQLWEQLLYSHSKGRNRNNPPPLSQESDQGGFIARRYTLGRKKLHSRDIDRLIEDSLF